MVMRRTHVPGWMLILSLVEFVRLYLRAGRLWLAWMVSGLRTLSLILDFVCTPNLNYRRSPGLLHLSKPGALRGSFIRQHNELVLYGHRGGDGL